MMISFNTGETSHDPIIIDDGDTGSYHLSETTIHRWSNPTPEYDPNAIGDTCPSLFTDTDTDDVDYEDATEQEMDEG